MRTYQNHENQFPVTNACVLLPYTQPLLFRYQYHTVNLRLVIIVQVYDKYVATSTLLPVFFTQPVYCSSSGMSSRTDSGSREQEVELVLCIKYYIANIPNPFSDSSSSVLTSSSVMVMTFVMID